jgi:hypothetical protein
VSQILLALCGFMGGVFYFVVLMQFVRANNRARSINSIAENRVTRQSAHTGVARSRKNAIGGGPRIAGPSSSGSNAAGIARHGAPRDFQISGPGWSTLERDVYESIARSLTATRKACAGSRVAASHKAS